MQYFSPILAAQSLSHGIGKEPIVPFAILLVVILVVPIIFERLRLPGVVGLLAAGVVLGPHALNILQNESPTLKLLSDIGVVYLMFVAGLEIDMKQFRQTKYRSMGYGSLGFVVPLVMGFLVSLSFGFKLDSAILIGSLFASHTLLGYPIISRLGVLGNEAVIVTIGATIFTDIASLLVLAICVGIHAGNFTIVKLVTLVGSLVIYSAIILFGFDLAGREFFRRSGDQEGNQFLFVLLAVFIAALGAQLIGVEKIVGAFLAGLAVNDTVGEGSVKDKVVFVGTVLFIPIFFVNVGLLIDLPAFFKSISTIWLTLALVCGPIIGKLAAAFLTKLIYRYNWQEMLTMWSLSLPQVAATLAATLVGYRSGLLNEAVFNSVIVLMLVTATLGPIITSRVAVNLASSTSSPEETIPQWQAQATKDGQFTVVVPVYNPETENYLIEMAALLARSVKGRIVPLSITKATAQMNTLQLTTAMQHSYQLLSQAVACGEELGVEAEPLLRIDDSIAQGISRASREKDANLILMGWGNRASLRARLLGNVIDSVLLAAHCTIAVTRLLNSPTQIKRILVPIENLTAAAISPLRFTAMLAASLQAQVTVLYVSNYHLTPSKIAWTQSQLSLLIAKLGLPIEPQVQVMVHGDFTSAILASANAYDLVVLQSRRSLASEASLRQNTSVAVLVGNDGANRLIANLKTSLVLLAEPQVSQTTVVPAGLRLNATGSGLRQLF